MAFQLQNLPPAGLGTVGWTDTTLGGPNITPTQLDFFESIGNLMHLKDEMGPFR
jgi:hypothetical protein